MSEFFRYPSILKVDNKYLIAVNIGERHRGKTTIITLNENFHKLDEFVVDESTDYISHNFTIFKDSIGKKIYGMGGLIRNQKPFYWRIHDKLSDVKRNALILDNIRMKEKSGIFLFESVNDKFNLKKKTDPVFSIKTFPKNATLAPKGKKKYESKAPEFDSNICCFYSHILNKYITFFRANICKGCRSVQLTTSDDLINWNNISKIKVPGFRICYDKVKADNYYMFKCTEIYDRKIFIALTSYTNDKIRPTQSYIKKLVSYDAINWIDLGNLLDCSMFKDKIHINTHIAEILYDESNKILDIFIFHNCFKPRCEICKYSFYLNEKEIEEQISSWKIDISNKKNIIQFNYPKYNICNHENK